MERLFITLGLAMLASSAATAQPIAPSAAAQLPKSGDASEYWDLLARFPDGHHIFARFVITNAGPGDRNGVAAGALQLPDGTTHEFQNARREERWTLSDDRLRLDIGKSHLDLRGPERQLEIAKGGLQIDLRFGAEAGRSVPTDALPVGYRVDLLSLSTPVSGTYWRKDDQAPTSLEDGRLALVHTVIEQGEQERVRRRVEIFSLAQDADEAMYLISLESPRGSGVRWMTLGEGTSEDAGSSQFGLRLRGSVSERTERQYWVPRSIELTGSGPTGGVEIGPVLMEQDPLGTLPQPLRWMLSLRMKPRRVWALADFMVTIPRRPDRAPRILEGTGLATLTFLDLVSEKPQAELAAPLSDLRWSNGR